MKVKTIISKQFLSAMLIFALALTMTPTYSSAKAKKVKLNKTKVTLYVGKTTTLKLKNNKKKIKWSSNKKKVATVSKKGVVKAKKKGTAKITAKVGKKKYTCKVTVKDIAKVVTTNKPTATPVVTPKPTAKPMSTPKPTPYIPLESISFDKTEISINSQTPTKITLDITPANATISTSEIVWSISDPDAIDLQYNSDDGDLSRVVKNADYYENRNKNVVITAKIGEYIATCNVSVSPIEAEFETDLYYDGRIVLMSCTNREIATVINIPDTINILASDSLRWISHAKELVVPSSVSRIESTALPYMVEKIYLPSSVKVISEQLLPSTVIFYGEAGSYAEQWANDNGYTFVATETPGIPETTDTIE